MTPQQKIGEILHTARINKKYTLEEIGNAIDVIPQTIQKYEKGIIKNIPYEKLSALTNVLSLQPSESIQILSLWIDTLPLAEAVVLLNDLDNKDIECLYKILRKNFALYNAGVNSEDAANLSITETDRFYCINKDSYPDTMQELKNYVDYLTAKQLQIIKSRAAKLLKKL